MTDIQDGWISKKRRAKVDDKKKAKKLRRKQLVLDSSWFMEEIIKIYPTLDNFSTKGPGS